MSFLFCCCNTETQGLIKKGTILSLKAHRFNKHFIVLTLDNLSDAMEANLEPCIQLKYWLEVDGEILHYPSIQTYMKDVHLAWEYNNDGKYQSNAVIMLRIPQLLHDYKLHLKASLCLLGINNEYITNTFMDYSDVETIDIRSDYNNSFKINDEVNFYINNKSFVAAKIMNIYQNKLKPNDESLNSYDIIIDNEIQSIIGNVKASRIVSMFTPFDNYINLAPTGINALLDIVCNVDCNDDMLNIGNALFGAVNLWLLELNDCNISTKECWDYGNVFIKEVMNMLFEKENKNEYICPVNCGQKLKILSQNHKYNIQTRNDINVQYSCDMCNHTLNEFEYMLRCDNHDICILCMYELKNQHEYSHKLLNFARK